MKICQTFEQLKDDPVKFFFNNSNTTFISKESHTKTHLRFCIGSLEQNQCL